MNPQETASYNRRMAKRLLMHYIRMAAQPQRFDHDDSLKIEAIVDYIINAAVKEAVEQIKAELAPKDEQPPETDEDHWQISDQQHEDNATYYSEVGEGIKRFQQDALRARVAELEKELDYYTGLDESERRL